MIKQVGSWTLVQKLITSGLVDRIDMSMAGGKEDNWLKLDLCQCLRPDSKTDELRALNRYVQLGHYSHYRNVTKGGTEWQFNILGCIYYR